MNKKALIIGIGGQDGSYLADLLVEKGYDVHGIHRRTSNDNLHRIQHLSGRIVLHRGDLSDGESIARVIRRVRPAEIYNEADQDHVGYSKETPQVSINITAGSVQRLLETVLECDWKPRVFQPVSATIFKGVYAKDEYIARLHEESALLPDSPYACAKAAALYLCHYYRRKGVDVICGIMFNHESERRGSDYLLQRIVNDAISQSRGKRGLLQFSNTHMQVDIGYAPEYMESTYKLMQLKENGGTFVIGTEMKVSIDSLIRSALMYVGVADEYEDICDDRYANERGRIADCSKIKSYGCYCIKTYGDALVRKLMEHKGVVTSHGK